MAKKRKKQRNKEQERRESVIAFVKVVSFLLPLFLYILLTVFVFPAPNSGFLFMGIVGSFFVGCGVIILLGLLDGMYFGHALTSVFLGIGFLMIFVSTLVMYVPSIYSKFDERYVTFYFLVWGLLMVSALYYFFFRQGVQSFFREKGYSKTRIKETLKGTRNFWCYEQAKTDLELGWIYYVNKGFLLVYLFSVAVHLALGWWKPVSPLIAVAVCLLMVLILPMFWLCFTTYQQSNFEKPKIPAFRLGFGFLLPICAFIAILKFFFSL